MMPSSAKSARADLEALRNPKKKKGKKGKSKGKVPGSDRKVTEDGSASPRGTESAGYY